jgi:hypothetical protein
VAATVTGWRLLSGSVSPILHPGTAAEVGNYHIEIAWWAETEYDLEVEISD